MLLTAMLLLGYGPLDWSFPWWMWALGILEGIGTGRYHGDKFERIASALERKR
jgi:hypothetical protein